MFLLPANNCEREAGLIPVLTQPEEEFRIAKEIALMPASNCERDAELIPVLIQPEEEFRIDNEVASLPQAVEKSMQDLLR